MGIRRGMYPVRGLLAILLIGIQVAGPWLCCCGPLSPSRWVKPKTESAHQEKSGPTCPHCRTSEPKAPSDAKDEIPKPHPEKCPYKGACWEALPASASDSVDSKAFAAFVQFNAHTANNLEPLLAIPLAAKPHGTATLPFLTTEARLYAHHALRC